MLRRIRGRLTYSNVVASMALFIALGGVSYAAVKLPQNSVGSTQIKNNAVTGSKVKDSSLAGSDVRNSALTGSDVRDGSLTAADFNGSIQGPQGAQGPQGVKGDTGPKGDPGLSGYLQVDEFSAFNSTSPKQVNALCPAGMKAIGGGAVMNGNNTDVALKTSIPHTAGIGWIADAYETSATTAEWNINVRVICANVAP